jgi:hypothetical protein
VHVFKRTDALHSRLERQRELSHEGLLIRKLSVEFLQGDRSRCCCFLIPWPPERQLDRKLAS